MDILGPSQSREACEGIGFYRLRIRCRRKCPGEDDMTIDVMTKSEVHDEHPMVARQKRSHTYSPRRHRKTQRQELEVADVKEILGSLREKPHDEHQEVLFEAGLKPAEVIARPRHTNHTSMCRPEIWSEQSRCTDAGRTAHRRTQSASRRRRVDSIMWPSSDRTYGCNQDHNRPTFASLGELTPKNWE